jgi:hypothetical protein
MRSSFLALWTISKSFSMQFHRERSALPPSGSVPYPSLIACWPRLFSTTYGQLSGAVTWFWKKPSLSMPSIFACLSACASIFLALFWRPAMRAIPVFPSAVCLHKLFFSPALVLLESRRWRSKILSTSRLWWSPMHTCCHAYRLSGHGFLLSDCPAFWAGTQLFSDHGGPGCHSGRNEYHATLHVIHAAGHLHHAAGGALHQPACRAEPAGPPGVPQAPSSWQQWRLGWCA